MAIAEELIAGVVSSVLAVLLVEIYLWLRRRYRHRALRWLIGTDTAAVVTPVYPWAENSHPAGLLTTYDAIGLAHVLEACNRIGTTPVVSRSGESAENSPLDVIAIGGPSGNQVTATFLKAYCPGFEILTDPETGYLSYRCGDRLFTRTEDETFAFIVRLSPRETGLPGNALIVWGHSAVSTASAGYYLARYASSLRKVGKGSFFVAISVRWVLGYRSFDTRPIDLTKAAFAPVPSRDASGPAAVARASAEPTAVASASSRGADSGSEPSGADSFGSSPGPDEPERRRRFGRAGRSVPAARSGRSRVAEALDDVRAAEDAPVAAASAPGPSGSTWSGATAVSSEAESSEAGRARPTLPSSSAQAEQPRADPARTAAPESASQSPSPKAASPGTSSSRPASGSSRRTSKGGSSSSRPASGNAEPGTSDPST